MDNQSIKFPEIKHPYCEKMLNENNEKCLRFHQKCEEGFSICPYGFSCFSTNEEKFFGFKILNYYNDKKIKGHERYSSKKTDLTIFTQEDFMKYVVNKKSDDYLELIKKHEIYRSTIHDIKRAISSIRDVVNEIDFDIEQKSIIDGYDLISTRLDYHDRILMGKNVTNIYGKIKPHKLLKKLSILLSYKANSRKIQFIFEGNPRIEVFEDSKGIFILFFILLDNSVKYSPINSNIIIRMKDVSKKATTVTIDNLCFDISNEDLNLIFERGYRGKNSEQTGGNGIGLSVAKQIMENNHIEHEVFINLDSNGYQHFIYQSYHIFT